MAIGTVSVGAFSGAATTATPGYPTGIAAGDAVVLCAAWKPFGNSVQSPAGDGFTVQARSNAQGGTVNSGNGAGSTKGIMYQQVATGSLTGTVTLTGTGLSPIMGQIVRIQKDAGDTWDLPPRSFALGDADSTTTTVNATNDTNLSPHTNGDIAAGDLVVVCVSFGDDAPTHSSQAIVIPGCTVGTVTWAKSSTTGGADGAIYLGYAMITAGSSTGDPSYTATASATGVSSLSAVSMMRWRVAASTTPVTETRATSWAAKAQVTSDRATTFDTLERVTATRATTWAVLSANSVTASRSTTWDALARVTSTRATTFDALARVTASRATNHDVLARVTSTRGSTWRVVARVTPTRATTWRVVARVTGSRATTFDVLTSATASRATTFDVLARVTSTRGSTWDTLGRPTSTRSTTWRAAAAVTSTRATSFDTLARLASPSSRATSWDVLARLSATRATSWDTLARLTATRATTFDVLAALAAAATRSTTWNVAEAEGLPAPTGLQAVAISRTQIDVTWNAVTGATFYEVERDGSVVAQPTGTTYSDTGLGIGSTHSYRVRAAQVQ